jgi:hypothetical protein
MEHCLVNEHVFVMINLAIDGEARSDRMAFEITGLYWCGFSLPNTGVLGRLPAKTKLYR